MTLRTCLVFALIASAAGAVIGRATWHDAPSLHAAPRTSSAHSETEPAHRGCKDERAALASAKAQLAICIALRTAGLEAAPSGAAEDAPPDLPDSKLSDAHLPSAEERQTWRKFVDSDSGTILVRHADGTLGVYEPDEWPNDGDGVVVARKLSSERIGWYAGPDAGPRSDPDAFLPWNPPIPPRPAWGREPDGTITINGKSASPGIQFMFGGKVDHSARPQK